MDVKKSYTKKIIPQNPVRPTGQPVPTRPITKPTTTGNNPPANRPTSAKKSKKKLILIILAVLAVAALAAVIVFQQIKLSSNLTDEQAAKNTQEKVAKIMLLPEEDALVSDITDIAQISEQPFFSKAENGDKVLIFVQSAKIVVYRESTNQIVNAGPLIDDRTTEESTTE